MRSVVGRAYYAVFSPARDLMESRRGKPFSMQRSVHTQVIYALRQDQNPTVAEIGLDLDRLRRERNRADYRGNVTFTVKRARKALIQGRDIARRLLEI